VSLLAQPGTLGEKTSVAAARILRQAILSGELQPGQTLGEEGLARQLGISRTPIREALVRLQGEGLVEMFPNRRAVVRSFQAADLHEMYSVRAVLEGYAASVAASKLADDDYRALEQSCARYGELQKEDKDLARLVEENFRFHHTIVRATRSERLATMIRTVSAVPVIYQSYMTYSEDNRAKAWQDHLQILDALRARDGTVAEVRMKSHVLWARDVALDHLHIVIGGT
jgi:DNA-binding GntR family transcriptional regulator